MDDDSDGSLFLMILCPRFPSQVMWLFLYFRPPYVYARKPHVWMETSWLQLARVTTHQMQAFVVGPSGRGQLQQAVPLPVRKPGEALVRVLRAGICNTDLEIMKGYSDGFKGRL